MDLSTTSSRVLLHSALSYILLPLSLLLNMLVFALVRKATKLGPTRSLIHAFCAVCILLSIAHAISVALQQVAYISIICLVGYMYIHRYRTMLPSSESNTSRWRLATVIIIAAIVQWESICLFIMTPDARLRAKIQTAFGAEYGIDFMRLHFLAVDLQEPLNPWLLVNGLCVLFEVLALIVLIIWCGFRIQHLISGSLVSESSTRIHKRVLRLLMFQAIHPLLLFELPSFVNFSQLMLNVQFPATVNLYFVLCIAVFPVTNPLLTMVLSKEIAAPLRLLLRIEKSRSAVANHTSLPSVISRTPHMPL